MTMTLLLPERSYLEQQQQNEKVPTTKKIEQEQIFMILPLLFYSSSSCFSVGLGEKWWMQDPHLISSCSHIENLKQQQAKINISILSLAPHEEELGIRKYLGVKLEIICCCL